MKRFVRMICLLLAVLLLPCAALGEEDVFLFGDSAERETAEASAETAAEDAPAAAEETAAPNADAPLEVHLINVASADCILLRKGELTMMIDSGNYSEADRIVDYLSELGISHLDYAMFTHPHGDHVQGYKMVLDAVDVGEFLEPALFEGYDGEGSDYVAVIHEKLAARGVPVKILHHMDEMDFGGATIRFYQWQNPDARVNNRSMIEHITFGSSAILLAADIESHAQKALAAELGGALRADILKMPHHGLASYTRELHAAVQPKFATVSHTRGNETVEGVLATLTARGVQWRLTVKGTIVCTSDGTEWRIRQEEK